MPPKWRSGRLALKLVADPPGATAALTLPNFSYVYVLLEPRGAMLAFSLPTFSYLLFLARRFVGVKKVRTSDQIVPTARYSVPLALQLVAKLYPNPVGSGEATAPSSEELSLDKPH
ncbi:MAG: hypothetical protein WAN87_08805 [Thermoplasmata archaeon]